MAKKKILSYDIINNIQDGIIVVSENLEVAEFNPAAEKICGISSALAENKSIKDIFSLDNNQLISLITKSLASGIAYNDIEYNFFRQSDLSHIPLSIGISPISNNTGEVTGTILLLRDLTLVKDIEENISRSERLATLDTLAASMAHEIKNPLGGIKGASQLLKNELKDKESIEYVDVIIKGVDRINRIVGDLLTFTNPKPINFSTVNIHKILEDALNLLESSDETEKITFHQCYDPSIPPIYADENKIFQIFLNLIKNSIEAMNGKGTIILTTRILLDYHFIDKGKKSTQVAQIDITDTGCGITEEQMKNIFTPFFTTKEKGNGLGLPMCHNLAEEHSGRIKVKNNKNGTGSTFSVLLPLKGSL